MKIASQKADEKQAEALSKIKADMAKLCRLVDQSTKQLTVSAAVSRQ